MVLAAVVDVHAEANVDGYVGDVAKRFALDVAAVCGTAFVGVGAVVLHVRLDIGDVGVNAAIVDIDGGGRAHCGSNGDVDSDCVVVAASLFACHVVVAAEQLESVAAAEKLAAVLLIWCLSMSLCL